MRLYCPEEGGHPVNVRFQPSAGERFCPEHGTPLRTADPSKPRTSQRIGRKESAAETRARQRFNRVVCEWPCFFRRHRDGHRCTYPLDAHHLVPKRFLRQRLVLDEAELLEVLYNPLIGAPLCRAAHDAVERGAERIYFEELSAECVEFVGSLPDFVLLRLEDDCPHREAAGSAASGRSTP